MQNFAAWYDFSIVAKISQEPVDERGWLIEISCKFVTSRDARGCTKFGWSFWDFPENSFKKFINSSPIHHFEEILYSVGATFRKNFKKVFGFHSVEVSNLDVLFSSVSTRIAFDEGLIAKRSPGSTNEAPLVEKQCSETTSAFLKPKSSPSSCTRCAATCAQKIAMD